MKSSYLLDQLENGNQSEVGSQMQWSVPECTSTLVEIEEAFLLEIEVFEVVIYRPADSLHNESICTDSEGKRMAR
jgi:hypothetical protein